MSETTIPSEALLCSACFSIVGNRLFYETEELEKLGIEAVDSRESARLAQRIKSNADGIVDLFEAYLRFARSGEHRRGRGMVFTPEWVARSMVSDALEERPDRVIDCGCGAGRFALDAAVRLSQTSPRYEVIGYDVDPLACLLTYTAAVVMGVSIRVVRGDYLFQDIPSISGKTVFLGNPPYVRHHRLSQDQKTFGCKAAASLGIDGWSKLSGLYALFVVKSLMASHAGDAICFVTGSEWLETNYGRSLRHAFASSVGGGFRLVRFAPEVDVFSDALSTALISYWHPGSDEKRVCFDYIEESQDAKPPHRLREYIVREEMVARAKWDIGSAPGREAASLHHSLIRLGDIFRVSRGVATGNNDYFVLKAKDEARHNLADYCVPVIARASDVRLGADDGIKSSSLEKRVFMPSARDEGDEAVRGYIALGEAFGVHTGYVTSHRSPWWKVTYKPAPVVATYMGRSRPCFALNPSGFPNLNTVHGLYPKRELSSHQLACIVEYLNHGELFGDTGRVYQGGLRKFEPKEMENILIPDLDELERMVADGLPCVRVVSAMV